MDLTKDQKSGMRKILREIEGFEGLDEYDGLEQEEVDALRDLLRRLGG